MSRVIAVRVEDIVTGQVLDDNLDVIHLPREGELIKSPSGKMFLVDEIVHEMGGAHVLRVTKL